MTSKDYTVIAAILNGRIKESDTAERVTREAARDTVRRIVWELMPLFEQDNPRFDRAKFLDAVWA